VLLDGDPDLLNANGVPALFKDSAFRTLDFAQRKAVFGFFFSQRRCKKEATAPD
jgi:hypothetical protein